MSNNSNVCACGVSQCKCGCQNPSAGRRAGCNCGDVCKCGATCHCKVS